MCGFLLKFGVVTFSYRYLSQQVKNETDLVLSPVTTHGGEVMEASLECLEKVCSNVFFLLFFFLSLVLNFFFMYTQPSSHISKRLVCCKFFNCLQMWLPCW